MELDHTISAVVSGGASGLGEAVARRLARTGVKVALFDLNSERGEALASELGGVFAKVDVADSDSVATGLAAARAAHGQERVMVTCAGIAPAAKTVAKGAAHDAELFRHTLAINLLGVFNCASQSAAGMVAAAPLNADGERGVIINTASVAAFEGQVGQIAYASSKAGVVGMTLPMARDLAREGIRVVTVAPGLFRTPMMEGFTQELQDALGKQVPFPPRLGEPAEFAELVEHICLNTMLNGETIRLDGAIRMQPR
jgi:NAD(P)-dependent dehydrogenase (short-subunit alcohol dehydrogenase family)